MVCDSETGLVCNYNPDAFLNGFRTIQPPAEQLHPDFELEEYVIYDCAISGGTGCYCQFCSAI